MPEPHLPELAVILAAGGGRRMGRPKGLLTLRGKALLLHHVHALRDRASRVAVVLGAKAAEHQALLPPNTTAIVNDEWASTWPADSLRLALDRLDAKHRCWVVPVDTPPPTPTTLDALLTAGAPAVPVDPTGRPGHPVLLDAHCVAQIRDAAPEGGLRTLLGDAQQVAVPDRQVALDFDDPTAWATFVASGG